MIPHRVQQAEILFSEKRKLRTEAEQRLTAAQKKMEQGDLFGAQNDLKVARTAIHQALRKVRELGEKGSSERSIQDKIESLWRKIEEEKGKEK